MPEQVVERDLLSLAKKNVQAYFDSHDVKYLTEDAVFTHMASGREFKGKEAIAGMIEYFYHIAFDAHPEVVNQVITEDKAVVESNFVGKHIGEFEGLAATHKSVKVPFCVSYDLENGLIKRARVYFLGDALMNQLAQPEQNN